MPSTCNAMLTRLALLLFLAVALSACQLDFSQEKLPSDLKPSELPELDQADAELDQLDQDQDLELGDTCAFCSPEACCDGVCVNLANDAQNCGSCGNACAQRELCLDGSCACPAGTQTCGDERCVDLLSDKQHCGACNTLCDYNCFNAVCSCGQGFCVPPQECCPYAPGALTEATFDDFICLNLQEDPFNCGGCGVQCGEGEVCIDGECRCGEQPGTEGPFCVQANTYCCADAPGEDGLLGTCLETGEPCLCGGTQLCEEGTYCCVIGEKHQCVESSTEHCGPGCRVCPDPNMVCLYDLCRCPTELPNNCEGSCVNVTTDPKHCGACGQACDPTQDCCDRACTSLATDEQNCGRCGAQCTEEQQCCAGRCRDVLDDPLHCGECGQRCGELERCQEGACVCDETYTACAGSCVELDSNPQHCGACGHNCLMGQLCCDGECVTPGSSEHCGGCDPCEEGFDCCGQSCVNTESSNENCGSCGNACSSSQVCCNGVCAVQCGSCSPACANGLFCCGTSCANFSSSEQHCGGCFQACEAEALCCSGQCTDIQTSLSDCGSCSKSCSGENPACCSGQCVSDLTLSAQHCGACGNDCGDGECCPTEDEDVACVDTQVSLEHCGGCGQTCAETCCEGNCVNLQTNDNNCGACGNRCGIEQNCVSGTCTEGGCELSDPHGMLPVWAYLLLLFAFKSSLRLRQRPSRKAA
ncbi:MAG: hypothetical protein RBU37_01655 [Myxococcota bacterium]|jgi:hypothetical protein|nr:hypothetical protein [Myxococcota bacterium]